MACNYSRGHIRCFLYNIFRSHRTDVRYYFFFKQEETSAVDLLSGGDYSRSVFVRTRPNDGEVSQT